MRVVTSMEGEFNLNVRFCFKVSVSFTVLVGGDCELHAAAEENTARCSWKYTSVFCLLFDLFHAIHVNPSQRFVRKDSTKYSRI